LSGLPDVVAAAYERAVRNCPWVSAIWVGYLCACERRGLGYDHAKEVFERALAAGFQSAQDYLELWMALCQHQFRRLRAEGDKAAKEEMVGIWRETVERASTYMTQYFQDQGDPGCRIPIYRVSVQRLPWLDVHPHMLTGYFSHSAVGHTPTMASCTGSNGG